MAGTSLAGVSLGSAGYCAWANGGEGDNGSTQRNRATEIIFKNMRPLHFSVSLCKSVASVTFVPYSLGNVTPRCAWYLPFLSLYDFTHGSSPWKNSTWAIPSFA